MKVATLPFNAVEGTPPSLGRQISNFIAETIRAATDADLNPVSFLAQIEDTDGPRAAFVNISDTLLDAQWLDQMFEQSGVDMIMDGLLERRDDGFKLVTRFHKKDGDMVTDTLESEFKNSELFATLHNLVKELAKRSEITLPEGLSGDQLDFGTDSPEAFLTFLEGYDAVTYIQQANGRVAKEFEPQAAMQSLLKSLEIDPDFVAPYEMLVQLARMCGQYRLGTFDAAKDALTKLTEIVPDDFKAFFGLGELYQGIGDFANATNAYEKAIQIEPNEAALYTRLGIAQMEMGMPVNAERNFKKAVEMEGPDKPSLDFLAGVLQQTNRAHEIPALWKEVIDQSPQNGLAHAKYGMSLHQAGREDDAIAAYESALTSLEDSTVVKRFYAPILVQKENYDRAMDFYEDCLDAAPDDVQVMLEYAQTLKLADREFEVPKILRDVLNGNADQDTKANALSWLIEIEQPKRVEAVQLAGEKIQNGQFEAALTELRPLKNWLNDYWKLWGAVANAANQAGQHEEAEEAATRLLNIFPGFEPGYGELARSLNSQGKHDEAHNVMRHAAQRFPQSLAVHVNLALAAHRAGHKDEARQLAAQIREAVGQNDELEAAFRELDH